MLAKIVACRYKYSHYTMQKVNQFETTNFFKTTLILKGVLTALIFGFSISNICR